MYIELFFALFKLMGLAPTTLLSKTSEKCRNKSQRFEFSYLGTFYNICLTIVIIAVHGFWVYTMDDGVIKKKKNMLHNMTKIYILVTFFIIFLTIFNFTWNQRSVVKFMNELYSIHLSLLNFDEDYLSKRVRLKYVLIVVSGNGLMSVISVYMLLNDDRILKMALVVFNSMLINFLISQYLLVIMILQTMVKCINRNFELSNEKFFTEKMFFMVGLASSKMSPNTLDSTIKTSRVLVLRNLCLRYYDTTSEISDFYSLVMLGCIAKSFGSIVINAYLLLDPMMKGHSLVEDWDDVVFICWLFYDFFSMAIITFTVTRTQKEVKI